MNAMNRLDLEARRDAGWHPSPPLALLATVYTLLFLSSLVVAMVLAGGEHFPSPFGPAAASLDYFSRHGDAVRWSAFLQFGAAVPLGLFTATAASRLQFMGVRAAGVFIALFGGIAASAAAALSALLQWVLSAPGVAESQAAVRVLHLASFAVGGPGHVIPLGLLIAGVSITSGLGRLAPRWLMTSGLVLAVLAELSWLTLVVEPATYLLPLVRFPAFAWLIAAGVVLPRSREEARARQAQAGAAGGMHGHRPAEGTP